MLPFYNSWKEAPGVPKGWKSAAPPGHLVKVAIKNKSLLNLLRTIRPGEWKKVYHLGHDGTELHYCQHESGLVCDVEHKTRSYRSQRK